MYLDKEFSLIFVVIDRLINLLNYWCESRVLVSHNFSPNLSISSDGCSGIPVFLQAQVLQLLVGSHTVQTILQFVPKFYNLVPVNFNVFQCLFMTSTGIPGELLLH